LRKFTNKLFFQLFVDSSFKTFFTASFGRQYVRLKSRFAHLSNSVPDSMLDYGVQIFTIPTMTPACVANASLLDFALLGFAKPFLEARLQHGAVSFLTLDSSDVQPAAYDISYMMRNPGVLQWMFQQLASPDSSFRSVFRLYFEALSKATYSNRQTRALVDHVLFQDSEWQHAFTAVLGMQIVNQLLYSKASLLIANTPSVGVALSSMLWRHMSHLWSLNRGMNNGPELQTSENTYWTKISRLHLSKVCCPIILQSLNRSICLTMLTLPLLLPTVARFRS
jgi:hypothetical protein